VGFMSPSERLKFLTFLTFRALVGLLDLAGILAIGLLATSIALFLTEGSDPNRVIEIGDFKLGAINAQSLPIVAALILLLFVSKALLSILLTRQLAIFLAKIEARASRDIAASAFSKGLEGIRKHSRDEILFAALTGSPNAFNLLLNSVGTLIAEGFLFVFVLMSFSILNPAAALGAVIYFGLIGLLIQHFIGRQLEKTSYKMNDLSIASSSSLLDLSEVYRESTILGRRQFFIDKLYAARLAASRHGANQLVLNGMPRHIVETSLIISIGVFILLQTASGDIATSAATLGVFLSGGLRLTAALLPLQSAILSIKQALPAANRAFAFLDTVEDDLSNQANPKADTNPSNFPNVAVSLDRVSFRYQGSEQVTLDNISIAIPAGAQAAFIGLSGAGKSTLADLVLGLLTPTSGKVVLGDQDAWQLIRNQPGIFGYVPQKPGMVSGTISENIALGIDSKDVNKELLDNAISLAHLKDLVQSLPNGVETNLGKRKDELSGGQLQRIGLARALYAQPKLLIMDEATSALDAESEDEINKALDEMRGQVTVILIAHRLNTVQRSDIVFLIEEGKVTASGTFPELLKTNDRVQSLAKLMAIEGAA
jgi:ABC-type multidrug transport system fused ATPase/permease subunit